MSSNPDSLDLIERNLVLGAVVQLGGTRRLMRRNLLGVFERAAVLHVSRNPGRAKCVTAGGVGQGGCLRSPLIMAKTSSRAIGFWVSLFPFRIARKSGPFLSGAMPAESIQASRYVARL